ncbi:hypothetical protein HMI56_002865 [Coelomomyces lativittatus]|nr:hypothetical protein HMI56_002865 [Coelomomyces lativittatus]
MSHPPSVSLKRIDWKKRERNSSSSSSFFFFIEEEEKNRWMDTLAFTILLLYIHLSLNAFFTRRKKERKKFVLVWVTFGSTLSRWIEGNKERTDEDKALSLSWHPGMDLLLLLSFFFSFFFLNKRRWIDYFTSSYFTFNSSCATFSPFLDMYQGGEVKEKKKKKNMVFPFSFHLFIYP